jgi:hypothetical protein
LTQAQIEQRIPTQRILASFASQIRISPEGLNLHGGPAPPYTVSDIGDRNIRTSPVVRSTYMVFRHFRRRGNLESKMFEPPLLFREG